MGVRMLTQMNETSRLQKAEKSFKGQNFVRTLGIISPANPMAKMTSKEENQRLVQKFKDYLRQTGEYYFPVKGKYGITEPSFMIFNTTRGDLEMWAKVFKQESFIYGEFTNGEFDFEIWKRKPNKESYYLFDTQRGYVERDEDGDYYTAIGRNFKFSIPFPKFMESVNAHNELITDRVKRSAVYAKLVEGKLTKILDESFTPLSRRMERSFVYGADWDNQFEEAIEELLK